MILRKFERKYKGKKTKRKVVGKKKQKINKKIDLKLINYFYILLTTFFNYFNIEIK